GRRAVQGEEAVLASIVCRLAATPKDRSADYLMWVTAEHSDQCEARAICGRASVIQCLSIVADPTQSLPERPVAAWHCSGIKAHRTRVTPNPTRSELVRTTLRGIKRARRCAQRQAKPLLREDLFLVLDAMGDGTKDIRDRALLLIGFAGALRRSELVSLDVA